MEQLLSKTCLICRRTIRKHWKGDWVKWQRTKYCSIKCRAVGVGRSISGPNHRGFLSDKPIISKPCLNCEFPIYQTSKNIKRWDRKKFCSKRCMAIWKFSGTRNRKWKGGKFVTRSGYILVKKPDHPSANPNGYVFEHRFIMEQHIGRLLKKHEVVHHHNHIKSDNRIENLHLFPNNAAHMKYHQYHYGLYLEASFQTAPPVV